jgi:DNA polymerase-4
VKSSRERKSLGKETTFQQDVTSLTELTAKLIDLGIVVLEKMAQQQLKARTLTVKVKYADFEQITRSHTLEQTVQLADLKKWVPMLLTKTEVGTKPVRLVGLSLSGFEGQGVKSQLDLELKGDF